MKIKKMFCLTVCVSVMCSFLCACSPTVTEAPNGSEGVPENVYSSLIGLLEGEIEQLRNEQKKAAKEYMEKLDELESLLENKDESTAPSDTDTEETSPFTYTVSDGKAEITGYSGNYSVLVIPSELDGYTVV